MRDIAYHNRQYQQIYRSTEKFVEWLENKGILTKDMPQNICDMACGGGANINYLSSKYTNSNFVGIDCDQDCIIYGNEHIKKSNCQLHWGDWFSLDAKWVNQFDGIISFQTLSWLSEYQNPLKQLALLNPKWIALSSLFYEGDIEYTIKLKDYYRPQKDKEYEEMYYNIYSLIRIEKYFKLLGYTKFEYIPYDIDIDLPKAESLDIGTYTVKTADNRRLQVSGALMMPWYFIIASK